MKALVKIVRGYGSLFGGAVRVLALLAFCGAVGCAIVFPLWKFATATPAAYTVAVLALLVAALGYAATRKCRQMGARRSLRLLVKALIVLAGLGGCIVFVLYGKRMFALVTLVVAIALYGIAGTSGLASHAEKA